MNADAKVFVPSSEVAIKFEGRMSAFEAFTVTKTLLYNPVCCDFCSNAMRTLREYYLRAAAASLDGTSASPGAHPGIWLGVSDMDHILRHALSSQSMRLDTLKKKLIRSKDLLNMLHNPDEIEAAIEDTKSTIQSVRWQLQSIAPKCRRRLSFEDTDADGPVPPLPSPFAIAKGGFWQATSLGLGFDPLTSRSM